MKIFHFGFLQKNVLNSGTNQLQRTHLKKVIKWHWKYTNVVPGPGSSEEERFLHKMTLQGI